jgi:8-oxo-dGTP diphosphatase
VNDRPINSELVKALESDDKAAIIALFQGLQAQLDTARILFAETGARIAEERDAALKKLAEMKNKLAVGVSLLLIHEGYVLLGKRRGNIKAAGWFSTPGGRIEEGEKFLAAAEREFLEECGARVDPTSFVLLGFREHFRFEQHYIMIYILATRYRGEITNMQPDKCFGWEWYRRHVVPDQCTEPNDILDRAFEIEAEPRMPS